MQTSKWGPPAWRFIHCLPLCASSDELTENERKLWIEFFELLSLILPCKYCRASYAVFYKEDPLRFNNNSCRLELAQWLYALHNKVNNKLAKTLCTDFESKCCRLNANSLEWEQSFWEFVLTIVWNYKEEKWRQEAYTKFFTILPQIISSTPLGRRLADCSKKHKLKTADLASPETMKQWAWSWWKECHSKQLKTQFSNFQQMDKFFEGWRSKTCSSSLPPVQSGDNNSQPAIC